MVFAGDLHSFSMIKLPVVAGGILPSVGVDTHVSHDLNSWGSATLKSLSLAYDESSRLPGTPV